MSFQKLQWLFPIAVTFHNSEEALWLPPWWVQRAGYMHYEVSVDGQLYRFPVSLEDLGTATLLAEHKAITLMRYIRKALEDHTFVKA